MAKYYKIVVNSVAWLFFKNFIFWYFDEWAFEHKQYCKEKVFL